MEYTKDLSIVISLFNEEESLPELVSWIEKVMLKEGFSYEILMIDDGSRDSSWSIVKSLAEKNAEIEYLRKEYVPMLERNLKETDKLGMEYMLENARLLKENQILSTNADTAFHDGLNEAQDLYAEQIRKETKAQAIKEFAERLKEKMRNCAMYCTDEHTYYLIVRVDDIDSLVKEMVGDAE